MKNYDYIYKQHVYYLINKDKITIANAFVHSFLIGCKGYKNWVYLGEL